MTNADPDSLTSFLEESFQEYLSEAKRLSPNQKIKDDAATRYFFYEMLFFDFEAHPFPYKDLQISVIHALRQLMDKFGKEMTHNFVYGEGKGEITGIAQYLKGA